jgi:hypothetical protein
MTNTINEALPTGVVKVVHQHSPNPGRSEHKDYPLHVMENAEERVVFEVTSKR